jgi:hypothetical protein
LPRADSIARHVVGVIGVVCTLAGVVSLSHTVQGVTAGALIEPYEDAGSGIRLLFLGVGAIGYAQLRYRGGLYTIVGLVLGSIALYDICYFLEKIHKGAHIRVWLEFAVFCLLAVPALLLLVAGSARNQRLKIGDESVRK